MQQDCPEAAIMFTVMVGMNPLLAEQAEADRELEAEP
jgi:hypothetical protein